jgi:hypothetical protein
MIVAGQLLPPASMTELLFASVTKRWLSEKISVAERLAALEFLADTGARYGAAAVAAIEPADDTTLAIVSEAVRLSLDRDDNGAATFAVLETPNVMGDLVRLNPSLVTAAGLCQGRAAA